MRSRKPDMSEAALVSAIRERQAEGARALYTMYSASLYGRILQILPDAQLSEDVLQETFIRIWYAFDQYDPGKGRLFTWMVHIARHAAVDMLHSKGYRKSLLTAEFSSDLAEPPSADDPAKKMDARIVSEGLQVLRPCERRVLELVYHRGFTHVETAEMLKIPLGTVKTRLCMAIRTLRNFYAADLSRAS